MGWRLIRRAADGGNAVGRIFDRSHAPRERSLRRSASALLREWMQNVPAAAQASSTSTTQMRVGSG